MNTIILVFLVVLLVIAILFWREWWKFNNVQTELLYKCLALTDYRAWREEKINSLSEKFSDVEINGLGFKYDTSSKDCLIARRYKHKVDSKDGWENDIVWQIRDLRSGAKIDDVFWGTALPGAVAGDGNRRKSAKQIERDQSEKKRAEQLLRGFDFVWDN